MKSLSFTKMHGTGNDFVLLDGLNKPISVTPALAKALADRHRGAGADQVLLVERAPRASAADFRLRIFNADGSEVEMCGNGIRCAARYVMERGGFKGSQPVFQTPAGLIRPQRQGSGFRVDMGEPILDAARIPTAARGRVREKPFSWLSRAAEGPRFLPRPRRQKVLLTAVSMGNPHGVIFVSSLDRVPVEVWGPELETHPFFPRRTNVEFVEMTSPQEARVRIWERGAGLTQSCGTGVCAVAVAGVLTGRFQRRVTLQVPGGTLQVEWAADQHVFLEGPATFVFDGVWRPE